VLRDTWGVPHLYARDLGDLVFAQGFVHAQDRLWQLELNRRVGQGRLAELFGAIAFDADRLIRTVGIPRSAEVSLAATDAETRALLERYAAGVNAFLERGVLPIELRLLRHTPEPWRPIDTVAWSQMMAWGLSVNWDSELVNAALVARLGVDAAAQLLGEYPAENPVVTSASWAPLYERAIAELRAAETWLPLTAFRGLSNNWVVSGAHTASGRPLLANDPHLAPQMPSIWYEAHLACPELEVAGVSLPGAPGVVIGHNARIAWGFTAAVADTQDLYVEEVDGARYRTEHGWEPLTMRREEIRVGRETRTVEIAATRHGPIISGLAPGIARGAALALKWTCEEPNRILRAALRLGRAQNWDEFSAAVADWDAPTMNAVYADVDGHIGYRMIGRVPRRARGLGVAPVPGWTGEYEWTGVIPPAELPHVLDPPAGVIATANNRVAGVEYPHHLASETMNGFRARRILELLAARDKHAVDDFARMQIDQYCAPARPFCAVVVACRDAILARPELAALDAAPALAALGSWDCVLSADSRAGAIYELMLHFCMRRTFGPRLGALTDAYLGAGFHPLLNPIVIGRMDRTPLVMLELLERDDRDWIPQGRAALLGAALADALGYLAAARAETWGDVHQVEFKHPLGSKKPLDAIFDRGPYPYGGDTNTVWQAAWVPRLPIKPEGGFTASWRQVLDVGDWDQSRGVHAPGQSGHPASEHYDDMIPLWLRGELHALPWTRAAVEAALGDRLRLEPRR
jgi:penicillin G amidase